MASCEFDGIYDIILKYIPAKSKILESGCGLGRYVKYLYDRDYQITGLEYSPETVRTVMKMWPELDICQGDSAFSPFDDNNFDAIMSLGVIEHFKNGLHTPLIDIFRTLKPGGVAIITIPCFNTIRKIKRVLWLNEIFGLPRALLKKLFKKKSMAVNRFQKNYKYAVWPAYGGFFEYRLTPHQFFSELEQAGFEVLEIGPQAIIDGIYHELDPLRLLVKFHNWKFEVTSLGSWVNKQLSRKKFFHCHMQYAVAVKPSGNKNS